MEREPGGDTEADEGSGPDAAVEQDDEDWDFAWFEWILIAAGGLAFPIWVSINVGRWIGDGFWAQAAVVAVWGVGDLAAGFLVAVAIDTGHRLLGTRRQPMQGWWRDGAPPTGQTDPATGPTPLDG